MKKVINLLCILLAMFLCGCDSQSKGIEKPNVLFIAVDDLNDWVGALNGHPQAITPNLDRLFDKGVLFTNAHCSQAVCTASRNSLLSGIHPVSSGWYASTTSMSKNYDKVMEDNMMLPEYFRANGYKTMTVGKIWHNGESDFKDKTDQYWDVVAPHFWRGMEQHIKDNGYGYRGYMFYPFPKNGGQLVQLYGTDTILNYYINVRRFYSLCGGPLDKQDIPGKGMVDEQIAEWTVDQLNTRHDSSFFLATGFVRPHVPYAVPRKYFEMYDPNTLIIPDIPEDEMKDIPMYGKAYAYGYTPNGGWYDVNRKENMLKELVHSYLASVTFVDDQIGKVIDALEQSPYANNTIIVLWSDHGQHLGEKHHFRKQALWEESTHVPLFFYDPRFPQPGVCDETVSLLDIYPTLADMCQLPENAKNQGRSIKSLIENPAADWAFPVLSVWQYKNYSVRSKDWRYIRYRDGGEELYDHRSDPGEHHNMANQPEYQSVIEELRKWLPDYEALPAGIEDWEGDSYDQRVKTWEETEVPEWLN